jgi:hypothetical protein
VGITADMVVIIRPGFLERPYGSKRKHGSGNGNNVALIIQTFSGIQQDKMIESLQNNPGRPFNVGQMTCEGRALPIFT